MESHCLVKECKRLSHCKGYCRAHYSRLRRCGDVMADVPLKVRRDKLDNRICDLPGCNRIYLKNGWCRKHARQAESGLKPRLEPYKAPNGSGHKTKKGYVHIYKNGKLQFEHRIKMEEMLGRPLLENETVHHINGIRSDNRPENLELWCHSQPYGQRVEDLVSWAKEILGRYDN